MQMMSQPPYGPPHILPFYILHYTYAWEYNAEGAMAGPGQSACLPGGRVVRAVEPAPDELEPKVHGPGIPPHTPSTPPPSAIPRAQATTTHVR